MLVAEKYKERAKLGQLVLLSLSLSFIPIFLLAVSVGAVQIPIANVLNTLTSLITHSQPQSDLYWRIIVDIRLPRLLSSILVGIALASGGVSLQTLFRNPLAEPYILGVSAGASLGVALSVVTGTSIQSFGPYVTSFMAFFGAVFAVMLVYSLSKLLGMKPISVLLLGLATSFMLAAVVTFLQFLAQKDVDLIFAWLMGSFSTASWTHVNVLILTVPVGVTLLFIRAKDLNVLLMGDHYAEQVGVNVKGLTEYLVIVTALLTAVAVAAAGIIGFVGVVIPLIARFLVGLDHKILIPASCLLGAIILALSDTLARFVIRPSELPVGVVTSLIGAPLFVYFLIKFGSRL